MDLRLIMDILLRLEALRRSNLFIVDSSAEMGWLLRSLLCDGYNHHGPGGSYRAHRTCFALQSVRKRPVRANEP